MIRPVILIQYTRVSDGQMGEIGVAYTRNSMLSRVKTQYLHLNQFHRKLPDVTEFRTCDHSTLEQRWSTDYSTHRNLSVQESRI